MKININIAGLVISVLLMLVSIPYTIYALFDTTIPFDMNLLFFSGIAIILFLINFYYYKNR